MDEIPEAIRESIDLKERSRSPVPLIIGGVFGIGIIGLLVVLLFFPSTKSPEKTVEKSTPEIVTEKPEPTSTKPVPKVPQKTPAAVKAEKPNTDNLLGHLPYDVAPKSELAAITSDGQIQMRSAAAAKFKQMQAAAQAEGVILSSLSGFRTIEDQDQLFFGVKEQRVQNASKRAEVSAPPGYSEHHTGYAIDIGDGNAPATNVNPEFEKTAAFRWLQANAARYSFELSFPQNNAQGVSYEPWHWRFVGDRQSLETFYKARN